MKSILGKCKICKIDIVTSHESDACEDMIRRLLPLLTCNRCSDMRDKFHRASDAIFNACTSLVRLKLFKMKPDDEAKVIDRAKRILAIATHRYAEVMADYRNIAPPVWSTDFVDQLMENPGKATIVLRAYRNGLKRITEQGKMPYADL
jgi:hypothetical protein